MSPILLPKSPGNEKALEVSDRKEEKELFSLPTIEMLSKKEEEQQQKWLKEAREEKSLEKAEALLKEADALIYSFKMKVLG